METIVEDSVNVKINLNKENEPEIYLSAVIKMTLAEFVEFKLKTITEEKEKNL